MRCLALADELQRRGAETHFICRDFPGHPGDIIRRRGHSLSLLQKPLVPHVPSGQNPAHAAWLGLPWETDAAETLACLPEGTDWLVVDHYGLDARWESAVAQGVRRVLVIDDLADRPHTCDVLLDQNLQSPGRYASWVESECVCLLGPDYALLPAQFRRRRPAVPRRPERVARLLVFFGGGDASNETGKVLEALPGLPVATDVVIGTAHARSEALAARCASLPRCQAHFLVEDMALLMARADLALGATGVSTWERACMGLPALVVSVADNQHPIAQAGQDAGLHTWLGPAWEVDTAAWRTALIETLAAPARLEASSAAGLALVDGLGVPRVADRMAA